VALSFLGQQPAKLCFCHVSHHLISDNDSGCRVPRPAAQQSDGHAEEKKARIASSDPRHSHTALLDLRFLHAPLASPPPSSSSLTREEATPPSHLTRNASCPRQTLTEVGRNLVCGGVASPVLVRGARGGDSDSGAAPATKTRLWHKPT
jgi:hypothetical protein